MGQTILYASYRKRKSDKQEKDLETQLIALYKGENAGTVNKETYTKLKMNLKIYEIKKYRDDYESQSQVKCGKGAINEFL